MLNNIQLKLTGGVNEGHFSSPTLWGKPDQKGCTTGVDGNIKAACIRCRLPSTLYIISLIYILKSLITMYVCNRYCFGLKNWVLSVICTENY